MGDSRLSTVLIVGAGPTGMAAAIELTRLQIPVRIIDKMAEPAKTSRAIGVQARTLELMQQRGLSDAMVQKGSPALATCLYGDGKRVFRLNLALNGSDFDYVLIIAQSDTEAVLRQELERQGVTIEREVELIALSQSNRGDCVKAILKHQNGSRLEEYDCAYMISTEGAKSICRTTLDQQFKGKTRNENFLLGDMIISDVDFGITDVHIFISEHGFMALFPIGEGRFRMFASIDPKSPETSHLTKAKVPPVEEFQKIYNLRSHLPARLHDMSWASWFTINSRMVDKLRVGRVFLGGDSAHIHSPTGAQGMNTGIQDMINLCWKLAFVMKGQADPKLLDTYTDDRVPVIRDVLKNTEGLTEAINMRNFIYRKAFSILGPLIMSREVFQTTGAARMGQLLQNYRTSPLSVSHGKVKTEVKAGERVPMFKVVVTGGEGEGTHETKPEGLYKILNIDRFTLLFANLTDEEATLRSVETSLAAWNPLFDLHVVATAPGDEEKFRKVFGTKPSLVLVRPDAYVGFIGTENSLEALAEYFSSWFPAPKETKF